MHTTVAQEVLNRLAALIDGNRDFTRGICAHLPITNLIIHPLMEGWEHHSGDAYYPIFTGKVESFYQKQINGSEDPMYTYAEQEFDRTDDFWEGKVGQLRVSLCQHMVSNILLQHPDLREYYHGLQSTTQTLQEVQATRQNP